MTREPEWDLETQEWAIKHFENERLIHGLCGGHYDHTHDDSVARNVESLDDTCLDCKAIDAARERDHKTNGRKGDVDACSKCNGRLYYVAGYVPKVEPSRPDW